MRSGLVQPDVYSYKDPEIIQPFGEAVVSQGLEVRDAINGYGAVTRGLLWQRTQIWIDTAFYDGLSTLWADATPVITTNWTSGEPVITTTWTTPIYGMSGEYQSE